MSLTATQVSAEIVRIQELCHKLTLETDLPPTRRFLNACKIQEACLPLIQELYRNRCGHLYDLTASPEPYVQWFPLIKIFFSQFYFDQSFADIPKPEGVEALEGTPLAQEGVDLLRRLEAGQAYVDRAKREGVTEAHAQKIPSLFGRGLAGAPGESLLGRVQQTVDAVPYLMPLFIQVFPGVLSQKEKNVLEHCVCHLDKFDWDAPLYKQFTALTHVNELAFSRALVVHLIEEIEKRTAAFPEEKRDKILKCFLCFCGHHVSSSFFYSLFQSGVFTQEDVLNLFLDRPDAQVVHEYALTEEDFIALLSIIYRSNPKHHPFLTTGDLERWDLKEEHRFQLALSILEWCEHSQLEYWLCLFSLGPERKMQLARRLATKDLDRLLGSMHHFETLSEEERASIVLIAIETDAYQTIVKLKGLWPSSPDCFFPLVSQILTHKELSTRPRLALENKVDAFQLKLSSFQYHCLKMMVQLLEDPEISRSVWKSRHLPLSHYRASIEALPEGHRRDALVGVLCLLPTYQGKQEELLEDPWVRIILDYRDPQVRKVLFFHLASCWHSPERLAYVHKWLENTPQHAQVPLLLIAQHAGKQEEALCDALVGISKDRLFKDMKHLKVFVSALHFLASEPFWTDTDRAYLLTSCTRIAENNGLKAMCLHLRLLKAIVEQHWSDKLTKEQLEPEHADVEKILLREVQKLIPITPRENFQGNYLRLNEQFRVPHALLIYAGKAHSESKDSPWMKLFTSFVDALFIDVASPESQAYLKLRYSLDTNVHLHTLFSTRPELYTAWQGEKAIDLQTFLKTRKGLSDKEVEKYAGWTIVKTHNPVDLMLCGTEIDSCLNISGTFGNNRALLAYPCDGKNDLLAIKDKEGRLIIRRLFRVLSDAQQEPVLFLERQYPTVIDRALDGALTMLAKEEAQDIQLPLLHRTSDAWHVQLGCALPSHCEPVFSLGSSAPAEYTDSLGMPGIGEMTEGVFTILDAEYLWKPN